MTNPLIVDAVNEDAVGWDSAEGGGVFSGITDVNSAMADGSWFQVTYTALGAAIDVLGVVADPLDSLVEAGLGFLVEHVAVLHEPLDALAGDPTQIVAQAQTWHNVARELHRVGREYRAAGDGVAGWDGASREAYRGVVTTFTDQLHRAGDDARRLAGLVLETGAMVGTVRAVVRDLIIGFVWDLVKWAAVTIASAGTALGGVILWTIEQVTDVGFTISRRISDLLDALEAAGGVAGQLAAAVTDTALQARVVGRAAHEAAEPYHRFVERVVPVGEVIEHGKQHSGMRRNQDGWDEPAPSAVSEAR